MEKKEYKKVHKKENKKNYVLMKISSISLIVSMAFSVVLILLGIFSTIKLPLFIALIVINLLILATGVGVEYFSEKRFNKDYKNYKAENTVVARKIEASPRKERVKKGAEVVEEKITPKKTTTSKKTTKSSAKTNSKTSTTKKKPTKKTTTKKTTKKA